MNYTVVGLFPNNDMANDASNRLDSAGFSKEDYTVSNYRNEGDVDATSYDYEEDAETTSFWDRLFGTDDSDNRRKYGYAGSKSNVVTVYTDSSERAEEAKRIMDDAGAISVDDSLDENYHGMYGTARTENDYAKAGIADTDMRKEDLTTDRTRTGDTIEVVKEDLNVGKKEVADGGIKVRSRIIERPVTEKVELKQERVYVKRNAVNRPVRGTEGAFANQTIEMTQTKEVPVVQKDARVVEEISLGKDVTSRQETVQDTVRETKVDVIDESGNVIKDNGETRI